MVSFFFNDTATTEIYTLSLHDALPIFPVVAEAHGGIDVGRAVRDLRHQRRGVAQRVEQHGAGVPAAARSEEHTSELQSRQYLVCRLLLEKKKESHAADHEADGGQDLAG